MMHDNEIHLKHDDEIHLKHDDGGDDLFVTK